MSDEEQNSGGHEIEEIYKILGFGRIQWAILTIAGLYLLMVLNETLGFNMVTIASQCDFDTNSVDKAIMSSAGFMGIVVTCYFWGYLSDTIGRRKLLIYTSLIGNLFSITSMFLPNFWAFVVARFLVGVFISGASSVIYAYLGEFFTTYYRPIVINYASMCVGLSQIYCPAFSWLILSMNWSLHISDEFIFRPWRLILLFYLLPGLIASLMLLTLPESPRYYLSVGKHDEAYKAVDWICRKNKNGQCLEDFKVFKIKMDYSEKQENILLTSKGSNLLVKMWNDTKPLFQRKHVLNFFICCISMMGLFIGSSGMGLWYPTIQNRLGQSSGGNDSFTVCEVMESSGSTKSENNTDIVCDDVISEKSYIDSMTIGGAYIVGYIILGLILNPVGRKIILVACLSIAGICGIILLWIKQPIVVVVCFIIFLALPGLSISVLSGAVVDLMPTHLRGKAVCIALMLGRLGSVMGSNIIGALLETQCIATFSFFGGFGLLCAVLILLLPI